MHWMGLRHPCGVLGHSQPWVVLILEFLRVLKGGGWSQGVWVFLLYTRVPGMEKVCNTEVHSSDIEVRGPHLSEPRWVWGCTEHS